MLTDNRIIPILSAQVTVASPDCLLAQPMLTIQRSAPWTIRYLRYYPILSNLGLSEVRFDRYSSSS